MKSKKLLKFLLIALLIVTAGVIFTFVKDFGTSAQEITVESEDESGETESSSESDQEETNSSNQSNGQICVHVCGAVNEAGVYFLDEGCRVYEAVEMAGGLSDDAAAEYINLAQEIEDGQQIYIPTYEEAELLGLTIGSSLTSDEDDSSDSLVNINSATSQELQTLPGIGQSKADAIIAYREENGDFSSIEEITNVSGIGESTYENIKDYITV